jgi:thiamine kinase-like enzyme
MNSLEKLHSLKIWSGPVEAEPLKGGLSNESYTVTAGDARYVVRFGRDFPMHHVSREHEAMASKAAHAAGFAPELVHSEPGVMVFRFIAARTYAAQDVRANVARIAAFIRNFHRTMPEHVTGAARLFWVFHVIRDYAATLRRGDSRMLASVPHFLALGREFEAVQVPLPVIYGHNDLLPANFLDDGERLWLIDYEYAGFNTAMFDLAGIASNALFGAEDDDALLDAYFGRPPDAALLQAFAAMKCASLLREAMWSMVSEIHLDAPGADYAAYTAENLERLDAALDAYRSHYGSTPI